MGLAASRQEAFWEACGFGHVGRARKFLEEGDIDVNWVSYVNDCSPIHVASQGKPAIVQLLLEHRCNVNVKDNRGNLALHHAAMTGHADIIQTLIDAGSEINTQEKNGWTALHNAAYWCHPRVVQVLIDNGCDVNIQNKDERTALHEVARSPSTNDDKLGAIAKMLIDAGSDINAKSSDLGEADLTGLMYASYHNHPEVAQALIDAGCELDAVGSTFWTALHWAADRGHDELVYILVDAGANPLRKNMRGETPADRSQSDDIREVLINAASMYRELHKMSCPLITNVPPPVVKPVQTYVPKCDANFKSESFLPKDWKPSVNLAKLKELRDRLREQHLKSLKNNSADKEISHDTGQETRKVKEIESKNRLSSVEPISRESSVTTDPPSTNSDSNVDTSSGDDLMGESQERNGVSNVEKSDDNDVENDNFGVRPLDEIKDSKMIVVAQLAEEESSDIDSVQKESLGKISERTEENSSEEFKTGDNVSIDSNNEDDFESLSVISNQGDKEDQEKMPEEEVTQTGDCKENETNRSHVEKLDCEGNIESRDRIDGSTEKNQSVENNVNEVCEAPALN